jgi:N6-L-threonylcarbamoyladenine synthase
MNDETGAACLMGAGSRRGETGPGCVLGIESSCDETAAAVIRGGREILSNVVASQIEIHRAYGGVVPEVASRQHVLAIVPVVERAMRDAGLGWDDLAGVAVTFGPGLAGALLVGVNHAKGLSLARGLPLVGVNHLEGHIYANWAADARRSRPLPELDFPLVCLIVSGGHSDLLVMSDHGEYHLLGRTIDDAAGEAFDKVARILGLGYPGGPAIQKAAEQGDPTAIPVPRAWLRGTLDFSFSGLKTAMLHLVEQRKATPEGLTPEITADLAAAFQESVVDVLVEKTNQAIARRAEGGQPVKQVLLAGGVAANSRLRQEMRRRLPLPVFCPPPALCTDNAVGTAMAGYYRLQRGVVSGLDLDVDPSLRLV